MKMSNHEIIKVNGLKKFFEVNKFLEGVVWHHPDGRMVKIKRKDFGYKWPENY